MRNFSKTLMILFLAGLVGMTSCIDNTVSDEVKQIRQAQAALLNAKADYQSAVAAYQAELTRTVQIANDYDEASNLIELQKLTAAAEVYLQQQALELEKAMVALAVYIVESENDVAEAAMVEYVAAMIQLDALVLGDDNLDGLIDMKSDLAKWNLLLEESAVTGGASIPMDLVKQYLQADLVDLQADLAIAEAKLADLKAILDNPADLEATVWSFQLKSDSLTKESLEIDVALAKLENDIDALALDKTKISSGLENGDGGNDVDTAFELYTGAQLDTTTAAGGIKSVNETIATLQAELDTKIADSITHKAEVASLQVQFDQFNGYADQAAADLIAKFEVVQALVRAVEEKAAVVLFHDQLGADFGVAGAAKTAKDALAIAVTSLQTEVGTISVDGTTGLPNAADLWMLDRDIDGDGDPLTNPDPGTINAYWTNNYEMYSLSLMMETYSYRGWVTGQASYDNYDQDDLMQGVNLSATYTANTQANITAQNSNKLNVGSNFEKLFVAYNDALAVSIELGTRLDDARTKLNAAYKGTVPSIILDNIVGSIGSWGVIQLEGAIADLQADGYQDDDNNNGIVNAGETFHIGITAYDAMITDALAVIAAQQTQYEADTAAMNAIDKQDAALDLEIVLLQNTQDNIDAMIGWYDNVIAAYEPGTLLAWTASEIENLEAVINGGTVGIDLGPVVTVGWDLFGWLFDTPADLEQWLIDQGYQSQFTVNGLVKDIAAQEALIAKHDISLQWLLDQIAHLEAQIAAREAQIASQEAVVAAAKATLDASIG